MCDCCNTARGLPEFRQFNPACKWCGARYLKAVKTVSAGPELDAWRASILDTWEKHGHDRMDLRDLAKPVGVPLAPAKGV